MIYLNVITLNSESYVRYKEFEKEIICRVYIKLSFINVILR